MAYTFLVLVLPLIYSAVINVGLYKLSANQKNILLTMFGSGCLSGLSFVLMQFLQWNIASFLMYFNQQQSLPLKLLFVQNFRFLILDGVAFSWMDVEHRFLPDYLSIQLPDFGWLEIELIYVFCYSMLGIFGFIGGLMFRRGMFYKVSGGFIQFAVFVVYFIFVFYWLAVSMRL